MSNILSFNAETFLQKYIKPHTDTTKYNGNDITMYKLLMYFKSLCMLDTTIYCSKDNFFIEWNSYYSSFELDSKNLEYEIQICKTTYFLVLLNLTSPNFDSGRVERHCNLLILNKKEKTFQRFDPHGCKTLEKYNPTQCDLSLTKLFPEYKQIELYIEEEGVQTLQCMEPVRRKHYLTNPSGFCGAWICWYIDFRFNFTKHEEDKYTPTQLLSKATDILKSIRYSEKEKTITLRNFIRNYSDFLCDKAI